jgi:hypothetical protein
MMDSRWCVGVRRVSAVSIAPGQPDGGSTFRHRDRTPWIEVRT